MLFHCLCEFYYCLVKGLKKPVKLGVDPVSNDLYLKPGEPPC